jgi:hypothetical protein
MDVNQYLIDLLENRLKAVETKVFAKPKSRKRRGRVITFYVPHEKYRELTNLIATTGSENLSELMRLAVELLIASRTSNYEQNDKYYGGDDDVKF